MSKMEDEIVKDEDKLTEEDVGEIIDVISQDGLYKRAEIVKVFCPACGEEFIGTKRHAGGFIAGHQAYHEFENSQDAIMISMGGQ
tara:strand:+ start:1101 stop:1355 length:255 start_codon:yes stop_codon:yes gene_type:complete